MIEIMFNFGLTTIV